MNNVKGPVLVIGLIFAAVALIFFLLLDTTYITIAAFVVTLFGIAVFCFSKLFLIGNAQDLPWAAAFPMLIWRYLVLQVTVSAAFIIPEAFFGISISVLLFLAAQGILAAIFAIYITTMKAGKDIINQRGAEVKQKVSDLRLKQLDIEVIMREHPKYEKDLKKVCDALRYSDPMSHPSLQIYEDEIQKTIFSMQGINADDSENIPNICEKLLRQINDRNSRVKIMK